MSRAQLLSRMLLLHACLCAAAEDEPPPVTVLTKQNFRSLVTESEQLWLLKFYAPWCGHCKRMAPILDEVAEMYRSDVVVGTDAVISFGKVDCTVEKAVCGMWNVSGYPTVYLSKGSDQWLYSGSRSKDGLIAVIERMLKPAVAALASVAELEEMLEPAGTVAFLLGRSEVEEDAAHAAYTRAAQYHMVTERFAEMGSALAMQALAALGGAPSHAVVTPPFVAKFELGEAPVLLHGEELGKLGAKELAGWIHTERFPLFSLVDRHNFYSLRNDASRMLALVAVDPERSCDGEEACEGRELSMDDASSGLAAAMRRLAHDAELTPRFRFGMLDGVKWGKYLEEVLHTPRTALPRLIVFAGGDSTGFMLDEEGGAVDEPTARAFLGRAASSELPLEYMDMWGAPDRWWRTAKHYLPPLGSLDPLLAYFPRYSLVISSAIVLVSLVLVLVCWEPSVDSPPASPARTKAGKAE